MLTLSANVKANPASDAEVGVTKTTTPVRPTMADDRRLNRAETQRDTVHERTVVDGYSANGCSKEKTKPLPALEMLL